jgi:hypothetical protein
MHTEEGVCTCVFRADAMTYSVTCGLSAHRIAARLDSDPRPVKLSPTPETVPLSGPLYDGIVATTPADPLVIQGADGEVIFALRDDGSVEAPDFERIPEAAVIFWRNVLRLAELSGLRVRPPFESVMAKGLNEVPEDPEDWADYEAEEATWD